jgi:tetratricopeptide (TPR) repeat protein
MAKRAKSKPAPKALPQSSGRSAFDLSFAAGAGLIVLATCLAYFPSLNGGFILDDDKLLTDNALIKATDGLYRFWFTTEPYDYWPVFNTTLWLEWRLWGMNPTGYHVINLLLHIVEALMIWGILQRLSIPGAFLAALLFAVHPVNVETVAWISQCKSLLAMLFFLLSIHWYLKSETPWPPPPNGARADANRWYGLSLAAFVLALLSKGSVAVLPPLLLGLAWWLRPLTKRDLLRTAPFFLVAVVLVRVNIWFQTHGGGVPIRTAGFAERLLGASAAVWFYLYKALLPVNLAFIYPRWQVETDQWRWWLPLLAAVAVTCLLWTYRQAWSRPLLFAWGCFGVALVPVLGFTDVGFMSSSLVADHYQHVALIGVLALVAAGWGSWQRRVRRSSRWIPNAAAVAAGALLTLLTWRQSGLYANGMTLYRASLEQNPDSWMAHDNLGAILSQAGRLPEAIDHFQAALKLKPDFPDAHNNLGSALLETGRPQEAIEHFEQTLRSQPNFAEAHNNVGNALRQTGRLSEAIGHYEQALRLKPEYPEAHNNLGIALADTGQLEKAIRSYQQALRLKPDYPEAHNNMGSALGRAGRLQEAIEHIDQALRLKPDFAGAQNNMGSALAQMGRFQEAIDHFEQALRLNPDYPDARQNLETALAIRNRAEPR